MPETMTAHRFPGPPARSGSALDPTSKVASDTTTTEATLAEMAERRDGLFDQSISSELSMYAGGEDVSADLTGWRREDDTVDGHSAQEQGSASTEGLEHKQTAQEPDASLRPAKAVAPSPATLTDEQQTTDAQQLDAPRFGPSLKQIAQFADARSQGRARQRTGMGKRGSVSTLASVMTTGDSVYEDALETPNETGDEDGDEDVTDYYASLPIEIPSTPPHELRSQKQFTPNALRSPLMDLNVVSASPTTSPRSPERGRNLGSDEKRARRQSLQDPTSPTIIPLRRTSISSRSAAESHTRRHSSITSLSGSELEQPLSPSSPHRDSRRQSFQLKPLVLTPQRTVITTGSGQSTSPSRRLSSESARGTHHRRNSSYASDSARSVSPFGTTSESITPPLSLPHVQGPNKRRSMGYFEPTGLPGDNETNFAGRRLRTASVDTGTTTATAESSLLEAQRRASSSPNSTVSDGKASPQMSDHEWDQQYRQNRETASVPARQNDRSKSRPPSTASTQLLRGFAAAALVGSHFSPLPTPQQMSPVPESPLVDQGTGSTPAEVTTDSSLAVKHTKVRRPAKYDEHWNGEAFESSPELGRAARLEGLAPAPFSQAARRPSSPREFQATFASPVGNSAAASQPRPAPSHKPIMIRAGVDRRGSKAKSSNDVAVGPTERRESAPASLEHRHPTSVSRRTSAFSLHRLSKVISDEIRAPTRTQLPTSTRPISGLAIWPPPEGETTKKVSAGPRLQSSPAASPQVDKETAEFSPALDNVTSAPYPFRSKRPSLLPRDPRAHIEGADAFLDILLNEEPPPRPRRQSAFDGYDGDHDANRWSTSSYASTVSTVKSPNQSPHQGVAPRRRFSVVFGGLTGGSKHRKSVGDLPNSRTLSTPNAAALPNTGARRPITIVSNSGPKTGDGAKVRSVSSPDARAGRPVSESNNARPASTASNGYIPRQVPMSPLMGVVQQDGAASAPIFGAHASANHPVHVIEDVIEPVEIHRRSDRGLSPARKLALPPGLGDSPDRSPLQKGFSKPNGIVISPRDSVRTLSPHDGRGSQRSLDRPVSPTSRDSVLSAMSSGSGSTTKATAHSVTPPASTRTTRIVDFAAEPTVVTLPPIEDVEPDSRKPITSIFISGSAPKRAVEPLHELPSATRAKKQASSSSLRSRNVAGSQTQMRHVLRSQVLER
ncbi:hypothetical protein OIV83_001367 [Microbotryomycetes sp. JL201]|nr:hypothetical protein OIV83_001367 [Microbotryomycetes sp. JL201]